MEICRTLTKSINTVSEIILELLHDHGVISLGPRVTKFALGLKPYIKLVEGISLEQKSLIKRFK